MSKRFNSTYPNIARAIREDRVIAITNEDGEGIYIAYINGNEVELGRVGYESQLERKLQDEKVN